MRFVVVTGMSGGGKRTALKLLEDAGFYCVDNLPVSLVEKFVELIAMPGSEISKVALGLDVRADQNFTDATRILEQLKEKGYKFEILFMDSDDTALIKRYKETRRVHPLAADGRVEDGIHKERKILETIRKNSDYVIDTSNLLIYFPLNSCSYFVYKFFKESSIPQHVLDISVSYTITIETNKVAHNSFLFKKLFHNKCQGSESLASSLSRGKITAIAVEHYTG